MRRIKNIVAAAAVAGALTFVLAGAVSAEVIDRIVAVVAGQIVTKSDVDAAIALGFASSLQDVIDRALMLNEVRRVTPPDPAAAAVDARVATIRARLGTPQALAQTMATSGINEAAVRTYAGDDLRLSAYLDDRFSSAAQPTEDDIDQVRRDRPELSVQEARAQVFAERRQTLIAGWVAELRRRTDITLLAP